MGCHVSGFSGYLCGDMMTALTMTGTEQNALENDARLVADCLAGDRDAFGRIVARHQSLICSLAYSATGSLTRSEDLAQETFVTAWKQLPELREPAKLRPWLCGIARNLIGKMLRRDSREPAQGAGPLAEAAASASGEPLPPEQVMSREEEAILWRSLDSGNVPRAAGAVLPGGAVGGAGGGRLGFDR